MASEYGGDLLADWLADNEVTREDAAKELNVSRVTIWNWIKRRSAPLDPVRKDISRMTGGYVSESSWGPSLDRRKEAS